eukprot:g12230.t1
MAGVYVIAKSYVYDPTPRSTTGWINCCPRLLSWGRRSRRPAPSVPTTDLNLRLLLGIRTFEACFEQFLATEFAVENLFFLQAVRRLEKEEAENPQAQLHQSIVRVYEEFCPSSAPYMINLPYDVFDRVTTSVKECSPEECQRVNEVFGIACNEIIMLLEDNFRRFKENLLEVYVQQHNPDFIEAMRKAEGLTAEPRHFDSHASLSWIKSMGSRAWKSSNSIISKTTHNEHNEHNDNNHRNLSVNYNSASPKTSTNNSKISKSKDEEEEEEDDDNKNNQKSDEVCVELSPSPHETKHGRSFSSFFGGGSRLSSNPLSPTTPGSLLMHGSSSGEKQDVPGLEFAKVAAPDSQEVRLDTVGLTVNVIGTSPNLSSSLGQNNNLNNNTNSSSNNNNNNNNNLTINVISQSPTLNSSERTTRLSRNSNSNNKDSNVDVKSWSPNIMSSEHTNRLSWSSSNIMSSSEHTSRLRQNSSSSNNNSTNINNTTTTNNSNSNIPTSNTTTTTTTTSRTTTTTTTIVYTPVLPTGNLMAEVLPGLKKDNPNASAPSTASVTPYASPVTITKTPVLLTGNLMTTSGPEVLPGLKKDSPNASGPSTASVTPYASPVTITKTAVLPTGNLMTTFGPEVLPGLKKDSPNASGPSTASVIPIASPVKPNVQVVLSSASIPGIKDMPGLSLDSKDRLPDMLDSTERLAALHEDEEEQDEKIVPDSKRSFSQANNLEIGPKPALPRSRSGTGDLHRSRSGNSRQGRDRSGSNISSDSPLQSIRTRTLNVYEARENILKAPDNQNLSQATAGDGRPKSHSLQELRQQRPLTLNSSLSQSAADVQSMQERHRPSPRVRTAGYWSGSERSSPDEMYKPLPLERVERHNSSPESFNGRRVSPLPSPLLRPLPSPLNRSRTVSPLPSPLISARQISSPLTGARQISSGDSMVGTPKRGHTPRSPRHLHLRSASSTPSPSPSLLRRTLEAGLRGKSSRSLEECSEGSNSPSQTSPQLEDSRPRLQWVSSNRELIRLSTLPMPPTTQHSHAGSQHSQHSPVSLHRRQGSRSSNESTVAVSRSNSYAPTQPLSESEALREAYRRKSRPDGYQSAGHSRRSSDDKDNKSRPRERMDGTRSANNSHRSSANKDELEKRLPRSVGHSPQFGPVTPVPIVYQTGGRQFELGILQSEPSPEYASRTVSADYPIINTDKELCDRSPKNRVAPSKTDSELSVVKGIIDVEEGVLSENEPH